MKKELFSNVRLRIYKGNLKEWILNISVDYIVYALEILSR